MYHGVTIKLSHGKGKQIRTVIGLSLDGKKVFGLLNFYSSIFQ